MAQFFFAIQGLMIGGAYDMVFVKLIKKQRGDDSSTLLIVFCIMFPPRRCLWVYFAFD